TEKATAAIRTEDIEGLTLEEATAYLQGLGFMNINPKPGSPSPDAEVGLVTAVSPIGMRVALTETITLTYNIAYGDPVAPTAAPSAPDSVEVDDVFTVQGISNPGSCPSGLSPSYQLII